MADYIGFNPPFVGGSQKIMSRQEDERLIRNDILNNLLILPGELPFRPNYGVNLRNFTFERLTQDELDKLRSEIISQISNNDSRLIVRTVLLIPKPDISSLEITVLVSLREDPNRTIEIKRLISTLTSNK